MADKAPGKPRKTTTSRKKETEQKPAQKGAAVTPIDQAGLGQNQGKISQGPAISGQSDSSAREAANQASAQNSSRSGAHPSADQSGAITPTHANPARAGDPGATTPGAGSSPTPVAKQGGSSPSVLNPRGSVQEGSHAAGVRHNRPDLDERIRHRAYELFEKRGRREGFHDEDWAQAEAEILAEYEREKSA